MATRSFICSGWKYYSSLTSHFLLQTTSCFLANTVDSAFRIYLIIWPPFTTATTAIPVHTTSRFLLGDFSSVFTGLPATALALLESLSNTAASEPVKHAKYIISLSYVRPPAASHLTVNTKVLHHFSHFLLLVCSTPATLASLDMQGAFFLQVTLRLTSSPPSCFWCIVTYPDHSFKIDTLHPHTPFLLYFSLHHLSSLTDFIHI